MFVPRVGASPAPTVLLVSRVGASPAPTVMFVPRAGASPAPTVLLVSRVGASPAPTISLDNRLRTKYNVSGPTQYLTCTLYITTGLFGADDIISLFWGSIRIESFWMKRSKPLHLHLNIFWCTDQSSKRSQIVIVARASARAQQADRLRRFFRHLITIINTGKMPSQAELKRSRSHILRSFRIQS